MTVDVNVTRRDVVAMQLAFVFRMRVNLYAFLFLWALELGMLRVIGDDMPWPVAVIASALGAAALFALFFALGVIFTCTIATRGNMLGPQRFETEEEGFVEDARGGRTMTRWPNLRRVVVTKTHAFVMRNAAAVHIIPKRDLAPELFDAFVADIGRRMAAAAQGIMAKQ